MSTPGLPDPYDGQPIVKVSPKVTNTGDGLSQSMSTDAVRLRLGEKLTVILDVEVAGLDLRPLDKDSPTGPLVAKYVLKAGGRATIVDGSDATVKALLDAQQKRNDEAAGKPQLPLADDPSVPSPSITTPVASNGASATTWEAPEFVGVQADGGGLWRIHRGTCGRAPEGASPVTPAAIAEMDDWTAATCCKPRVADALAEAGVS